MRFAHCLTSQGDTKNVIRQQLLFFLGSCFDKSSCRGVFGNLSPHEVDVETDWVPMRGADVRTVGGVEVSRAQAITPLTAQIYF